MAISELADLSFKEAHHGFENRDSVSMKNYLKQLLVLSSAVSAALYIGPHELLGVFL